MGGGGDGGGGCCDDEGGREAAVMTQEWVGSSPLLPKRSINQWARPLNGVMPCAAMDRVPSLSLALANPSVWQRASAREGDMQT